MMQTSESARRVPTPDRLPPGLLVYGSDKNLNMKLEAWRPVVLGPVGISHFNEHPDATVVVTEMPNGVEHQWRRRRGAMVVKLMLIV